MGLLGAIRDRLARRRARGGLAIGRRLTPEELAAEERAEDLLGSVAFQIKSPRKRMR